MKTRFLKLIILFFFFLLALGVNKTVNANSISDLSMYIYVNNTGTATITETWNCTTSSGTEVYHPYYNLGESLIYNLTVSENSRKYTTINYWDTSASFNQKAYKCGINKISNGVEICWGMSTMGSHTYTVKYNISNFVANLNDAQMIYWTLIPHDFSNTIGHCSIKIYTDTPIADTIDVWGYGKYGALCYVNNGAIYMDTDTSSLKKSEYMTILAKFPVGTFNTNYNLNKNFNYYYEMAEDGSTKYNGSSSIGISGVVIVLAAMLGLTGIIVITTWLTRKVSDSPVTSIISILVICTLFIFTGQWILAIMFLVCMLIPLLKKKEIDFGKAGKSIPRDVAYYRDIPCNGNIFQAYYIASLYGINKNKTDILGAIILSWLQKDIVEIEKIDGTSIFNRKKTNIILKQPKTTFDASNEDSKLIFTNRYECKLYNMLYDASGDGILENKEFEKWCRRSYGQILHWFEDIQKDEKEKLANEGLLGKTDKDRYIATPELKELAIQLAGLKRFLKDYSLIQERLAIEVKLFEDYLIFAQILGIAKEVAKEFKEIYPEFIEQTHFDSYDNFVYIHTWTAHGVSTASSAKAAAESYSSGGGGFSSGGGGGGSFGGGGGRRRLPLKYKL